MRVRGFETIGAYESSAITLPIRKTEKSAGYDLEAAEETVLLPGEVSIVPTGVKAYMQEDEYLGIHIRSGLSIKNAVSLVNGQGIIDADYYNNKDNEGHIMIAMFNHGKDTVVIKKGMRIAQGIFYRYLTIDDETAGTGAVRNGGFGSTGE